jgi:predicted DNA-binding transcriptional regulator YafY
MRASRLLSMLMLLQTRGRMSAQALAEAAQVSVRTIYRDADHLSAAGVPIYADRGRLGGFQLREGWRTQLDGLTAPEARAMLMAGLPGPAAELGLGEEVASAQLKLLAALPEDWQRDAQRVGARFHLDPVDWFRAPAVADHLRDVAQAVWSERRLHMRYRSWTSLSDRTIDPLGLVQKAGSWYLVARSERELRVFRVANILQARVLDEGFARPKRFDLARYWAESTQRFEDGVYQAQVTLRASPLGLQILRGFSAHVARAVEDTAGEPDEAGWREVVVPVESHEYAARELLRLGAQAQVMEPASVREALRQAAGAVLALYQDAQPSRAPRPRATRAK